MTGWKEGRTVRRKGVGSKAVSRLWKTIPRSGACGVGSRCFQGRGVPRTPVRTAGLAIRWGIAPISRKDGTVEGRKVRQSKRTRLPSFRPSHAEGGIRTPKGLRPLRPERSASTNSTTSARTSHEGRIIEKRGRGGKAPVDRPEVVIYLGFSCVQSRIFKRS